ncbi:DUF2975 domain-containing protein [Vibrio mimicus]|uniref:DUF2975 domain-containing protein n=1 Tax=Vibrio mimicus TaxID=674 RepID=UPI0002B96239|nr:DUF2975 domain-containing protein [Vibrio mimicus]EMB49576.1 hypothetical protein D908_12925 [Vibrio mimicus CAIM 602]MBY7676369.1 DUF2975 domain-containing protein [Vibrio mimicus]MBY7728216.1 DUF2975 domain-containing protein [Vibrio mimicus]TXY29708.1 DUF2975 domain-containing protein [Vibrio mimicus]SUQ22946.1 Protein of uncharacterised function (DUF2975) [Vibrio mimicus]
MNSSIALLSRRLLIILWATFILLPVTDIFLWLCVSILDWPWFEASFPIEVSLPLNHNQAILGLIPGMMPSFVVMAICWQLIVLFRLYKQNLVFTLPNVACFRKIANLLIALPFVGFIANALLTMALSYSMEEFQVRVDITDSDFAVLLIGLVAKVIARVMQEAVTIREEQDLTI